MFNFDEIAKNLGVEIFDPNNKQLINEHNKAYVETTKIALDDFGDPLLTERGTSPFETASSKQKVINPNSTNLNQYLKDKSIKDKKQKAHKLYLAFARYCHQNKINPTEFFTK